MRMITVAILAASLPLTPAMAGPTAPATVRGVQIELRLNKAAYTAGEPVEITLTLLNPATAVAKFQFPTGQMYDFIVSKDGQFVWQWSFGRAFTQAFTALTLLPGESKLFKEQWDQRDARGHQAPAGEYEMVAVFPAGEVEVVVPPQGETLRVRFAIVGGPR